jgi:hypothetical protein
MGLVVASGIVGTFIYMQALIFSCIVLKSAYVLLFDKRPLSVLVGVKGQYKIFHTFSKYEGRLQSSWTRLITPSRNFVEVR